MDLPQRPLIVRVKTRPSLLDLALAPLVRLPLDPLKLALRTLLTRQCLALDTLLSLPPRLLILFAPSAPDAPRRLAGPGRTQPASESDAPPPPVPRVFTGFGLGAGILRLPNLPALRGLLQRLRLRLPPSAPSYSACQRARHSSVSPRETIVLSLPARPSAVGLACHTRPSRPFCPLVLDLPTRPTCLRLPRQTLLAALQLQAFERLQLRQPSRRVFIRHASRYRLSVLGDTNQRLGPFPRHRPRLPRPPVALLRTPNPVKTLVGRPRPSKGYGLSEAAPLVSLLDAPSAPRNVGSASKPPRFAIPTVRPDGASCEPNETGELLVRGRNVMAGYWDRPDATREAVDQHGWLRTADAARIDDKGYDSIVDRVDDAHESSGDAVYPGDVERLLPQHPAVADAGVVAHDGTAQGYVVLGAGETLAEQELLEFCRARLAASTRSAAIGRVRGPVAAKLRRYIASARTCQLAVCDQAKGLAESTSFVERTMS